MLTSADAFISSAFLIFEVQLSSKALEEYCEKITFRISYKSTRALHSIYSKLIIITPKDVNDVDSRVFTINLEWILRMFLVYI